MTKQLGVFDDINDAIDAAYEAQLKLMADYTTVDRDNFIAKIKEKFLAIVEQDTIDEFKETGYGRLDQKIIKNIGSIAEMENTSGLEPKIMASGQGLTVEYQAPVGLVGALTPVTNGLVTVACNGMMMIAAGNSIVFNAHPGAKGSAAKATDLLNRAVVEAGGPPNIVTMVRNPDMDTLGVIMNSPKVKLLIGTGGEAMVDSLMRSSKKVIAAGPGNPPTVIDETADVIKAADTLYGMIPFENNMLCVTEKEAFVVESVYDEFVNEMIRCGARLLTDEEAKQVADYAIVTNKSTGKLMANRACVGRDANVVLEAAGVTPSEGDLQLAIFKADKDNPFVSTEQMMPIFPIVKCKDVYEAMDLAIKAEGGCRHSAAMWSADIHRITEFAKRIGTSLFAANGPTVAATGVGGTGNGSSTIATFTGEGCTTASSFTRVRRIAFGGGDGYTA